MLAPILTKAIDASAKLGGDSPLKSVAMHLLSQPAAEIPAPDQAAEVVTRELPQAGTALNDDVHQALTALDDRLVSVLEAGDIRLVRSSWLLTLPEDYRIQRRQDLEALERSGTSPSPPLLSPKEAVALIRKGDRSAGSLSYGWPLQGNPDPTGHRLKILREALSVHVNIEAFFWDFASLFQKPRTEDEEAAFRRSIDVMGDLYASAIGTCVLQLKEIPPRPAEYDARALYHSASALPTALMITLLTFFSTPFCAP